MHEKTQPQKDSIIAWAAFFTSEMHGNIVQKLKTVKVTFFFGKQGLSFRVHDEKDDSQNKDNFLELSNMFKEADPFLQKYNPPSNSN